MPKAENALETEDKKIEKVEDKTTDTKVENKDVKAGDILDTSKDTKKDADKAPRMVPESVLIEYKKESKEVRKELDALKKSIEDGASKIEVSADLKTLAEKHSLPPEFLQEFADAVRKEAKEDFESKMKPIEEKENAAKREKIFDEHFDKTMSEMPEYSKLVNKEVIKALAFDPKNANKSFAQIFESAYGHLVTGKKTLDTTKARGGKEDTSTVDIKRAQSDPAYFKEVMADPELKKIYNEGLAQRNRL